MFKQFKISLCFLSGVLAISLASNAFAGEAVPDNAPFKTKPQITFKKLPNGISERKLVFSPDPRLLVPYNKRVTFRVYIRSNSAIAISFSNLYINNKPDPVGLMQLYMPFLMKKFKDGLIRASTFRFISVMDISADNYVSGVMYTPTFFPKGMTSADLKW